jgi:hypothetical protein
LVEKQLFQERQSLQCTLQEKCKSSENKDIQVDQKGDYKPAYKKSQKTLINQFGDIPAELANIVAVWHDLPIHIKAAMTALVQTVNQRGSR